MVPYHKSVSSLICYVSLKEPVLLIALCLNSFIVKRTKIHLSIWEYSKALQISANLPWWEKSL